MACRAVCFALTEADFNRLRAAKGKDEAVLEIAEEIDERCDEDWLCQLDKAWDGIHRVLTDGKLEWANGTYPLNHAILGGEQLHEGEDEIITLVTPAQAKDVAAALEIFTESDKEAGYRRINPHDYGVVPTQMSDDDREYVFAYLNDLTVFYRKAADAGRAVLFTVDQ